MMAKPVLKSLETRSYRFVVVLLLLGCLLTLNVGRLVPVYALADPQPEIDPVYETEIIRLADYVDHNLQPEQQDIFYIMFGAYVAASGAMSEYHLEDPYTTQDGVLGWFKSTGIQLYNSLVDQMALMTPQVLVQLGVNEVVDFALGIAQKAGLYTSYTNFVSDFNNSEYFMLPITPKLQLGLNSIFALNGSLYNWQLSDLTIGDAQNMSWNISGASDQDISDVLSHVGANGIRFNYNHTSGYDITTVFGTVSSVNIRDFHILFIDTDDHTIKLVNDSGQAYSGYNSFQKFGLLFRNLMYYDVGGFGTYLDSLTVNYEYPNSLTSPAQIVNAYFEHVNNISNGYYPLMGDFVNELYAGIDWAGRYSVSLHDDLNFEQNNIPYYLQVQNDYLFDLKGFVSSLLNSVDLYAALIANFFNPDGTLNINPSLIKVSIDLPVITDTPALPVDLNDIDLYTHNEYLDALKHNATAFGSVIGEFVAFWHNADWELTYVVLGSCIIVLIGAFIGKWGHS